MAEEEDDASPEGKEDFSKEEKLHCSVLELTAVVANIKTMKLIHYSDDKVINHSFEIASPPPNC
jgi:hypothetical protein